MFHIPAGGIAISLLAGKGKQKLDLLFIEQTAL